MGAVQGLRGGSGDHCLHSGQSHSSPRNRIYSAQVVAVYTCYSTVIEIKLQHENNIMKIHTTVLQG